MLRPPHTRYDQLFVYNFDRIDLGAIDDPDLIETWIEDDTAILFFHSEKKRPGVYGSWQTLLWSNGFLPDSTP